MFKRFAALAALVAACGLAMAGYAEWTKTESGSFKIDRFWEETVGQYTCSYTIVSYKNTTNKTFTAQVSIQATVYDAQKNVVDMNTRSFFAHEYGPIKPGFEGTVKIPVECAAGQAKSVSVKIDRAQ
jgi:hypothetical protein